MFHRSVSLKSFALLLTLCIVGLSLVGGGVRPALVQGAALAAEIEPQYTACSGDQGSHTTYIETDTTWTAEHGVYHLTKHVEVYPGVTLTIEPGAQVWINEKLYFHVCSGASIIAKGTPDEHIQITRYTPDSGPRWNKIWFYGSSSSYFRYTDFSYGGSAANSDDAILHFEGTGTHVLNNCTVEASKQQGIVANGSGLDVTVAGTRFARNGRRSIMVNNDVNLTVTGSLFEDQSDAGVYLRKRPVAPTVIIQDSSFPVLYQWGVYSEMADDVCIDAQGNWWGATNGPNDASGDSDECGLGSHWGSGAPVSDGVDYSNWLTSEPDLTGITTPPNADFTVSPDPTVPQPLDTVYDFDASTSTDTEDYTSSLEVCWDWDNDGTCDTAWSTDKTATHSFSGTGGGTQTVRLMVRDTDGDTDEATQEIALNSPPTAAFTYTQPSWAQVDFDASSSSDDQDPLAALQVQWDYEGDGTPDTGYSTDKTSMHTYPHLGRFWPTVYVKDFDDLVGTARRSVDIIPPAASEVISGSGGTVVSVDGSVQVGIYTDTVMGDVISSGLVITHTPWLTVPQGSFTGTFLYQGFNLGAESLADGQPIEEISGTYTITIDYDYDYFANVLHLPFEEHLALYRWADTGASWVPVPATLSQADDRLVAATDSLGDFVLVMDLEKVYLPLIVRSD